MKDLSKRLDESLHEDSGVEQSFLATIDGFAYDWTSFKRGGAAAVRLAKKVGYEKAKLVASEAKDPYVASYLLSFVKNWSSPTKVFHGTSSKRADAIEKDGLRLGPGPNGFRSGGTMGIWLSTDRSTSETFARMAAEHDGSDAVILVVTKVPGISVLVPDPDMFVRDEPYCTAAVATEAIDARHVRR